MMNRAFNETNLNLTNLYMNSTAAQGLWQANRH